MGFLFALATFSVIDCGQPLMANHCFKVRAKMLVSNLPFADEGVLSDDLDPDKGSCGFSCCCVSFGGDKVGDEAIVFQDAPSARC